MAAEPNIRIDVWSDYVCPFCYLELPPLQALQAEMGERLLVRWRAFELRPEPEPTLDPDAPYLHRVWGQSVYPMAAERGMTLRLPPVQPRSRPAHEAAAFARAGGAFDAMHLALFRAFFEEGRDIGDVAVLADLAEGVGLPGGELRSALAAGRHREEVLADQGLARRLGLRGVPALVIAKADEAGGRGLLVQGAQPLAALRAAVAQAAA